jgi:hypothetical protein
MEINKRSVRLYTNLAVLVVIIGTIFMRVQLVSAQGETLPPVFVDEIIDLPLPDGDGPNLQLTGNSSSFLALPTNSQPNSLSGSNASVFRRLPGTGSGLLNDSFTNQSSVIFWYQAKTGAFTDDQYQDWYFSGKQIHRLTDATTLMTWVLNHKMDDLMSCAYGNTRDDIPGTYRIYGLTGIGLNTTQLQLDLKRLFSSNNNIHVAIGAFNNEQNLDGSYTRGVTWSRPLDSRPTGAEDLTTVNVLSSVLIGVNLNANFVVQTYMSVDVMAGVLFHEILHNFAFHHTKSGSQSNDLEVYRTRSKAILALQDCMQISAKSGIAQMVPVPVTAPSLRDYVLDNIQNAALTTPFAVQAQQFVDALIANLDDFSSTGGGVTQDAMQEALMHPDVGLRINATVHRIWDDWLPYGVNIRHTDPMLHGLTPLRVLVIRMIQERPLNLAIAEQRALYDLLTRSEPLTNWQNSMNGIIGAINRDIFLGAGNSPLPNQPATVPTNTPENQPPIASDPDALTPATQLPQPIPQIQGTTLVFPAISQIVQITDFESFGVWTRGDETWGTLIQSAEQQTDGQYAGKLSYAFPAVRNNYVVFKQNFSTSEQPDALGINVYGDGSTHFLNAWVQDARGQSWQFTFGRINHTGWQEMVAPLDLSLGWPNQAIGNASTAAPVFPLKLYALILDGYTSDRPFTGTIYIDDLEAITYGGSTQASQTQSAGSTGALSQNQDYATITSNALNVRSGPGTAYGVVVKARQGETYSVLGRDVATGWVQIAIAAAPSGVGWVSGQYVSISTTAAVTHQISPVQASNGSGAGSSQSSGPAPTPTPSASARPATASAAPISNASIHAVLVSDFETWGVWQRGDEPWGTFTQSAEFQQSGHYAGKFIYDFPSGEPNNYIVFRRTIPIAGQPIALRLQVYGDGSTHFLNTWLQDAKGQLWQFSFGRINHQGWRTMEASLGPNQDWPNQPIGHTATSIAYPIKLYALILDGYTSDTAFSGSVYVDDLEAISQ